MTHYGNTHHTEGDSLMEQATMDLLFIEYREDGFVLGPHDATALTWLRLYELTVDGMSNMAAQFQAHKDWMEGEGA